jgi:zinc protease
MPVARPVLAGVVRRRAMPLALILALFGTAGAAAAGQTIRDDQWPRSRPPRPLPAKDVTFPGYALRTLPNGLQVVAVSHHEQPAVSMRLLVRAGAAQDPAGKPGIANLVASLLDQGTTSRGAGDIAEAIDTIGGGLGAGAGTDLSFVSVVVMRDSFAFGLDLLNDIVRHPAFAPEEIARQREQILSSLRVSYEDPDFVADAVIDRLIWGFHPYGLPRTGTPASMASLTREDLVAFHEAWFAPNNTILAVVGDMTADEAFAQVERTFGSWPRRDVPAAMPQEPPPPTRRVIVVDRPGAVQTEIRMGNVAIPRKHDDYVALDLAVRVLGGEGANRLQRVLRSERGLTYAASADTQALKHAGAIVAETDTRSEATGDALRLAVDEVWRLQRERVHPLELADAQAYLTGTFPLTIETPGAIATQVLNVLFYDLDVKELATLDERVNAITVDDIQRVAKAYLHPSRLSIVLVGDAETIVPQIKSVGFTEFELVPIRDLDLAMADFRRALHAEPAER